MIHTTEDSIELLTSALNDLDEPYKTVALKFMEANTDYKRKVFINKNPDYESIIAEAYQRLRVSLSLKGIHKLADLPL